MKNSSADQVCSVKFSFYSHSELVPGICWTGWGRDGKRSLACLYFLVG